MKKVVTPDDESPEISTLKKIINILFVSSLFHKDYG
jgi:hypothetical protein